MNGSVFWITGLSGAGKSTVASLLAEKLKANQRPVLQLDGDVLRAIFAPEAKHSVDERRKLAMSYGRLCREIATQGIDVVCATVSMFHAVHRWNRENIRNYREIYLRVPVAELERRDAKGLYTAHKRGEVHDVVGIDIAPESPENPDLVIENYAGTNPAAAAERIWQAFGQLNDED
jgi:cytidine diphosphoramidate kinase